LLGLTLLERLGRDRYTLHPLIRAHAARLAQETAPGQAERVVADTIGHFCEFAESADRAIMTGRRRLTAGSAVHDDPFAGPNPRAAALRAMEHSREDLLRIARVALAVGADEQVIRLATATQALYFNHRHLADWTAMSDLAIAAASQLGRFDVEIQIRCTLSRAYADAGDLGRARAEIQAAFALLPAANDPKLAGTVWEFNGRLLDLTARCAPEAQQAAARAEAEAAFRTAIDIYLAEELDRGVALGRLFYGVFLDAAGRPADALPLLDQARDGLNAAGDDRNATRADAAIGAAHLHLGHYRRAYDELAAAAAYFAVAELWHYEVEVRENLALAATALGERAAAAEHAERAAEIRRLSDPGQ
jgi:tetratricopeptide (TPR) repeat protein